MSDSAGGKTGLHPRRAEATVRHIPHMDESSPPREDKSTSYTVGLTVLLMVALIVAAWALKRNAADHPQPETTDPAVPAGPVRAAASGTVTPSIPVGDDGKAKSDYQVVTDCRLEDDAANDGDTFRVVTPQGAHLFSLYWVQAVQMNGGSPESIREFMDHFSLKTEDRLRDLAVEGRDFTLNLLRAVPFRLVTKWEKDPADGAFLCFVYASAGDAAKPSLQNIALLLVQNGLAIIRPCSHPLPEMDTTAGDFHNQLTAAEGEARRLLCGGWAGKE